MLRNGLVRLVRAVKRDPAFDIDDEISSTALVGFVFGRGLMVLRGLLLSVRVRRRAFPVFVGRRVVVRGARHLSLSPGVTIGDYCRLDCLGTTGLILGRGVTLRRGVQIEVTSVLREIGDGCVIGDQVGISEGSFIGAKGRVDIGASTIIGPSVKILAENHKSARTDTVIREQGVTREGIAIGSDCWLGANAVVLDGVSVGDHAIVGAGAVVTKNVEPRAIVAGVPAKLIRMREQESQE